MRLQEGGGTPPIHFLLEQQSQGTPKSFLGSARRLG